MSEPELTCSFCHQPKSKVIRLIAGEGQAAICNYCIALCYDLLRRDGIDMTLPDQPPKNDGDTGIPG